VSEGFPEHAEVLIDGVQYVPATKAAAGIEDLLRALALQWHTPESLEEDGFAGLRVVVWDDPPPDGETFDELAARLATVVRGTDGDARE
jgi:hypothetical protein